MVLFLLPAGAFANGLSWSLFSPGGTSSWSSATGWDLIGTNIPIKSVTSTGTPLDNGTQFAITDGFLNFNTVANSGTAWTWGAGGSFSLMGCVSGVTQGTCNGTASDNDVALITGVFSGAVSIVQAGTDGIAFGAIQGTIDQSVANAFGLSTSFSVGSLSTTIQSLGSLGSVAKNSSFTGAANAGGAIATSPSISVSEDWNLFFDLIFFGFALGTFGLASRLGALRCRSFLG
jgi:lipoprotein signal peptidase